MPGISSSLPTIRKGGWKACNTSLNVNLNLGNSLVAWRLGYSPSTVSPWAVLGVVGLLVLIRHYKHCKVTTFSLYQFFRGLRCKWAEL